MLIHKIRALSPRGIFYGKKPSAGEWAWSWRWKAQGSYSSPVPCGFPSALCWPVGSLHSPSLKPRNEFANHRALRRCAEPGMRFSLCASSARPRLPRHPPEWPSRTPGSDTRPPPRFTFSRARMATVTRLSMICSFPASRGAESPRRTQERVPLVHFASPALAPRQRAVGQRVSVIEQSNEEEEQRPTPSRSGSSYQARRSGRDVLRHGRGRWDQCSPFGDRGPGRLLFNHGRVPSPHLHLRRSGSPQIHNQLQIIGKGTKY